MRRIWISLLALGLAGPISASAQPIVQLKAIGSTNAGTISANGGSITIDVSGQSTLRIQTLDTYSGTWEVQGSVDGTTYDTDDEVNLSKEGSSSAAVQSVTDEVGVWTANVAGYRSVKIIATAGFAASDTTFSYGGTQSGGSSGSGGGSGGGEVTNAGTFAVQESGTQLTEIQSLTHAEDSPHSSAHVGVQILGVRQDSQADFGADGDYVPFSINDAGELRVSGSVGGTSLTDGATFTANSTAITPIGGFFDDASSTACVENDGCVARVTENRAIHVNLRSAAGAELTPATDATFGTSTYTETSSTGPIVGGIRNDTLDALSNTNNEVAPLATSAEGALWTAPSATTNGGCTPHSIISANTVNETAIKASAGQLYFLNVTNIGANEVFFKLYNDTTANIDETDTPVQRYVIPGNAAGAGNTWNIAVGMTFSTAITYRITTGAADNDTGAIAASEVLVSACYK